MKPARIVVVDDDPDILAATQAILVTAGYEVSVAGGRNQGMDTIGTSQPDLIVLDVMMDTWQDGFAMARALKQDPLTRGIPILMMTAVKDKTGIDFKASAGDPTWLPVEAFLEKPLDPEQLLGEVRRLLGD